MSAPQNEEPRRAWRTDDAWKGLRARIDAAAVDPIPERRKPPYRTWGAAAAAALLVAAAGAYWWPARSTHSATIQEFATRAGERRTVRLADSTQVLLAPATTLHVRIGAHTRDVELTGLADFTVVHDVQRPFV